MMNAISNEKDSFVKSLFQVSDFFKNTLYFLDINNSEYPYGFFEEDFLGKKYLSISPQNKNILLKNQANKQNFKFFLGYVKPKNLPHHLDSLFMSQNTLSQRFNIQRKNINEREIEVSQVIDIMKENNFYTPNIVRIFSPQIFIELFENNHSFFEKLNFIEFIEFFNEDNISKTYLDSMHLLKNKGFSLLDITLLKAQRGVLPLLKEKLPNSFICADKYYHLDGRFGQPLLGKFSFYKDPFRNENFFTKEDLDENYIDIIYILYTYGYKDIVAEIIENVPVLSRRYKDKLLNLLAKELSGGKLTLEQYQKQVKEKLGKIVTEQAEKKQETGLFLSFSTCEFKKTNKAEEPSILLSIHIQSNRPEQLVLFFDKLEETALDYSCFEVCIKIDDDDLKTYEIVIREAQIRPFKIKYIKTKPPKKFPDLWESMNDLFVIANSNSYFYLNLNDEMYFLEPEWDLRLKKYKGLFPDGIYRLRTSRFRNFRYFDFWECGFAPETSALTTRKWLEIGGGWCPCLGPDTFQQYVSYYLSKKNAFSHSQLMRDVVINDIRFGGEVAFAGLDVIKMKKRISEATEAWFILVSHKMQTEASRRASKIYCHIYAHENNIKNFSLRDNKIKKKIELIDEEGRFHTESSYKLSLLRIIFANFIRKFNYSYYGGGGIQAKCYPLKGYAKYFYFRYPKIGEKIKAFIEKLSLKNE